MQELTYRDLIKKFMEQFPETDGKINDYRPYKEMDSIVVWLKGGTPVCVKYDRQNDKFELLGFKSDIF
jgi:hypothetical protein